MYRILNLPTSKFTLHVTSTFHKTLVRKLVRKDINTYNFLKIWVQFYIAYLQYVLLLILNEIKPDDKI